MGCGLTKQLSTSQSQPTSAPEQARTQPEPGSPTPILPAPALQQPRAAAVVPAEQLEQANVQTPAPAGLAAETHSVYAYLAPTIEQELKPHQRGVPLRVLSQLAQWLEEDSPTCTSAQFVEQYIKPATLSAGCGFREAWHRGSWDLTPWPQHVRSDVRKMHHPRLLSPDEESPDDKNTLSLDGQSSIPGWDARTTTQTLLTNPLREPRLYYVAHCYSAKISTLVAMLHAHLQTVLHDNPSLGQEDVHYWLDFLAMDMHYPGSFDTRPDGNIERVIIHRSHSLVVLLEPWHAPAALTRSWVLYELVTALLAGTKIEPLLDPALLPQLLMAEPVKANPRAFYEEQYKARLEAVLSSISINGSQATRAEDHAVIVRRMDKYVGYDKAETKVRAVLSEHFDRVLLVAALSLGVLPEVQRLGAVKIPVRYSRMITSGFVRAVKQNHSDVVHFMLKRGIDPNAYSPDFQLTALAAAVVGSNFELAKALIAEGADPMAAPGPPKLAGTLLHLLATAYTHIDDDPYVQHDGVSERVQLKDLMEFAQSLLWEGSPIEVNRVDGEGSTALHRAAAALSPELVELLMRHGADPAMKDGDDHKPLELAFHTLVSKVPVFEDWDFEDHFEVDPFVDHEPGSAAALRARFEAIRSALKPKKPSGQTRTSKAGGA